MPIPPWVYKGRTAIESLIPRASPVSAALHMGVGGVGASAAIVAGSQAFTDGGESALDFMKTGRNLLTLGVAPILLTAGMQAATPGGRALPNGIAPMYFLSVGAAIGAGLIMTPTISALEN